MSRRWFFVYLALIALLAIPVSTPVLADGGFDEFGYNNTARLFNGTGMSWCMGKIGNQAYCTAVYGPWLNDKLIMKWTADWDRGNDEGWAYPPYDKAWTSNEWNGMVPNGSGEVWHYKIKWVGPCGADYTPLPDGSYCIWGQFAVLMDQGTAKHDGHTWFAHGSPAGYGKR